MPNENLKNLPEVEQEEIKRILDLPTTLRYPTIDDTLHLQRRIDYLTPAEIKQFGLMAPREIPENEKNGLVGQLADIVPDSPKKPAKAKKSPKIAPKKAKEVVKKVVKKTNKRKAK